MDNMTTVDDPHRLILRFWAMMLGIPYGKLTLSLQGL